MHPTTMSLPCNLTLQGHAVRVLRDKFATIVDALEPGGSGDMYEGFNAEERELLAEVTRMGFPPRAWFSHQRIALAYTGILSMFLDNMMKCDPEYFTDFWTVPGYLGANPPESLLRDRVEQKAVISEVIKTKDADSLGTMVSMPSRLADSEGELPAVVNFEKMPEGHLQGNTMTLTSGVVAGQVLYISGVVNDLVKVGFGGDNFKALANMQAGDEVVIDNGPYLAVQTFHRHQVPSSDFTAWDQFKVAGKSICPQRSVLLGPRFDLYGMGANQTGRFAGKMIVVQNLMDDGMYAKQRIRCNAVCPGATMKNIAESISQDASDAAGIKRTSAFTALIPGVLEPNDIAALVLFLASDEARYINGAIIPADGGWDAV